MSKINLFASTNEHAAANNNLMLWPMYRLLLKRITSRLLGVALLLGCALLTGESNADDVEVVNTFGTNNVAVSGDVAFATAGAQGIVVIDLNSRTVANVISPAAGTNFVDDVSVDGDLLFTLDGFGGGLSVYSIANPLQPQLVSGPVTADVGPFAGVSAANQRVVVSGGTGLLQVRSYQPDGTLNAPVSSIDLGIGQPDVLISDDGETAYVSTDFAGNVGGQGFGITVIDLSTTPGNITITDRFGIVGAGFSAGTSGPANFPIESAVQGDTLFVASGNGVAVYDVSNPSNVQTITLIPLPTNPISVDVVNDTLYVVGNAPISTMSVIDVSDLSSPVVNTVNLPAGGALSVAATPENVVIADEFLGVLVESLFVLGDVNGDAVVNFLDIGPFIQILTAGGFNPAADINGDGNVNFLDIGDFIILLIG